MIVLDASALLALLFREPGHERVAGVVAEGLMSTVNLSEVLGRFSRAGMDFSSVLEHAELIGVHWVDLDKHQAVIAAQIVPFTQPFGLSLGDRMCLALAISRKIPVMTADRAWAKLALGIPIEVIR